MEALGFPRAQPRPGLDAVDVERAHGVRRPAGAGMAVAQRPGAAVGAGFDLVCTTDLAVASSEARFMIAYMRRALIPDLVKKARPNAATNGRDEQVGG